MPKREYTTGWLAVSYMRCRSRAGWHVSFCPRRVEYTEPRRLDDCRWEFPTRGAGTRSWWFVDFVDEYDLFEADGVTPSPPLKPGRCFPADIEL